MATFTKEQKLIDQIATEASAIDGITSTYGFAQNPDTLTNAQLPALLCVPASFTSELRAHHNVHRTEMVINGALFVAARSQAGGALKYLENRAMPFMGKFREKFQSEDTIKNFFALSNLTKAHTMSGVYGAGGPLLTHNGVPYIGIIFTWNFTETI